MAQINIKLIPDEKLRSVGWQQQAGLVSTWDRDAVTAWWAQNPVGTLKPNPVPGPNPAPQPNSNFQETSTFGALPSTLSAKVGLTPVYPPPIGSGSVSVWEFQYTDAASSQTKKGILKLYHDGLFDKKEKLDVSISAYRAASEHEMLWSVWQKVGLWAPDGVALISARDTALVSLDAADVEKLKYNNGKDAFPKVALHGVIMRKYGENLKEVVKANDKWPEKDVLAVLKAIGLALQVFHLAGRVHGDVKNLNVLRSVDQAGNDVYTLIDYADVQLSGSVGEPLSTQFIPTGSKSGMQWSTSNAIRFSPVVDRMMLLLMCCALLKGDKNPIKPAVADIVKILTAVQDKTSAGLKAGLVGLLLNKGETTLSDSFLETRITETLYSVVNDAKLKSEPESVVGKVIVQLRTFNALGGTVVTVVDMTIRGVGVTIQKSTFVNMTTAMISNPKVVNAMPAIQAALGEYAEHFRTMTTSITYIKTGNTDKKFNIIGSPGITDANVREIGAFLAKSTGLK